MVELHKMAVNAILGGVIMTILLAAVESDDLKYGSFRIFVNKAEACRGPKTKNCTRVNISNQQGGRTVVISHEVTEDTKPEIGKISSFTLNQKSATPLVRLQMNRPCEHIFLRPLMESILNLTERCIVRKGVYTTRLDVAKVAEDYFGGKFLYGNFSFKAVFLSKTCNFSCARFEVSIVPLH